MKLEPDKVYKVTKGNTDGSILAGDLVYIDGRDGSLVVPKGIGWIGKDEQTPSVMNFECTRIGGAIELLYYGEDYRKLEQELETAKVSIKKACRDFDKMNDELARLKRENEELKKNQATHINHVVGN